jgi:putative alpha-1,2-mannosidase
MVMKNLTAPTDHLYKSVTSLVETEASQLGQGGSENEVAKGLERAVAAKCVAEVASRMKDSKGHEHMSQLAKSYKKYWDSDSKMFWGGKGQGNGANPNAENARFVEGTAWQYSFLVPHDVPGLIDLFGSKK